MRRFSTQLAVFVVAVIASTPTVFANDTDIDNAVREYEAGNIDKAFPLLIKAVKDDSNNGKARYYLGLVEKKLGMNGDASKQFELAVKMCPTPVLQGLAKQALDEATGKTSPPAQSNDPFQWMANVGNNVSSWFGGKPAAQTAPSTQSKNDQWPWFRTPDLITPVKDAMHNTKRWIAGDTSTSESRSTSSAADVISMGEIQRLVGVSHGVSLTSSPGGVVAFNQAPEFTPEWDRWIFRFRRAINIILTRYLVRDVKDEKDGKVSVIFSLDKAGNLRGAVCDTTADNVLNQCMLKTIRLLNHNKGLAFPKTTQITGWNFRMKWDFGEILSHIRMIQQRQQVVAKLMVNPATLDTDAKLKAAEAGAHAKIGKLPTASTKTKVAIHVPSVNVKTGVAGQIMPKPKPIELKAVPLKLSDLPRDTRIDPTLIDVLDAMNIEALDLQKGLDEEEKLKEEERLKEEQINEQNALQKSGAAAPNQDAADTAPPATKP